MPANWSVAMPAGWLVLSALAASIVMFDMWLAGHRQPMAGPGMDSNGYSRQRGADCQTALDPRELDF